MKNLIIGAGQIGSALYEIFAKHHETYIRDVQPGTIPDDFEAAVLHICFPWSLEFKNHVALYVAAYRPKLTIIHSSVPVGTTDALRPLIGAVVHSPERGRFPNLAKEMLVYPKFIGGEKGDVDLAAKFFRKCRWRVVKVGNARATELLKLLSNVHMGLEIAWRQEVERMLAKHNAFRGTYELWEESYFDGYKRLGQDQLIRSRMRPDPIGGHCILECLNMLERDHFSAAFDFIRESNEKAKSITGRFSSAA